MLRDRRCYSTPFYVHDDLLSHWNIKPAYIYITKYKFTHFRRTCGGQYLFSKPNAHRNWPINFFIYFLVICCFMDLRDRTWPDSVRLSCPLLNWALPVCLPVYASYIWLIWTKLLTAIGLKCMFNNRNQNAKHSKMQEGIHHNASQMRHLTLYID